MNSQIKYDTSSLGSHFHHHQQSHAGGNGSASASGYGLWSASNSMSDIMASQGKNETKFSILWWTWHFTWHTVNKIAGSLMSSSCLDRSNYMSGGGMGMSMSGHSPVMGHHQAASCYSQNYGPSSYYSNMDYLSSSQLNGPVNHFAAWWKYLSLS